MPTENRSSNTEMVSDKLPPCADDVFKNGVSACLVGDVPKHAAETICQSLSAVTGWKIDWHYFGGRTHIKALAPAPQPHPDPIAWMVGTAIWWTKEEAERDAAATGKTITPIGPMSGIAPAEEHQGEPAALPERKAITAHGLTALDSEAEGWNACLDEIAKLGPLYARPVQGEPVVSQCPLCCQTHEQVPVGRAGGQQANGCDVDFTTWRCEGRGGSWTGDPADPGEVERLVAANTEYARRHLDLNGELERLRAENERLRSGFYQEVTDADLKKIHDYVSDPQLPTGAFLRQDAYDLANFTAHMCREVQATRAQLAERDALLRKCLMAVREQHCDDGEADFDLPAALMVEIDAALSASAEPSACEHDWIDARNQFVQIGELCIKCHAIRAGNVTLERKPS